MEEYFCYVEIETPAFSSHFDGAVQLSMGRSLPNVLFFKNVRKGNGYRPYYTGIPDKVDFSYVPMVCVTDKGFNTFTDIISKKTFFKPAYNPYRGTYRGVGIAHIYRVSPEQVAELLKSLSNDDIRRYKEAQNELESAQIKGADENYIESQRNERIRQQQHQEAEDVIKQFRLRNGK